MRRNGFTLIELLVVIAIIAAGGGGNVLVTPVSRANAPGFRGRNPCHPLA